MSLRRVLVALRTLRDSLSRVLDPWPKPPHYILSGSMAAFGGWLMLPVRSFGPAFVTMDRQMTEWNWGIVFLVVGGLNLLAIIYRPRLHCATSAAAAFLYTYVSLAIASAVPFSTGVIPYATLATLAAAGAVAGVKDAR